jgi:hypothetical protein
MKKSITTMFLGFCFVVGFSQNDHTPPRNISQSFSREYPQSRAAQWSRSNNEWSVSFEDNDHNNGEVTAHFDFTGRHIDTHIPYDNQDVPPTVTNHMRNQYGPSETYEYTRIDHKGEKPVYMSHYKNDRGDKTIYMDNNGREREKQYRDKHD